MTKTREQLWIAMSDLWLDQDLHEYQLEYIASVVRDSDLDEAELDDVFVLELAPFLGVNNMSVAGEWAGFDEEWVCEQARIRHAKYRRRDRFWAALGLTTYAARPSWERVKEIAFSTMSNKT